MRKLLARDLRDAGWTRSIDGLGWTRNGAYYGAWDSGACVGQFEGERGGDMAVQIDIPTTLPPQVVLHLINAMAEARTVLEESQ